MSFDIRFSQPARDDLLQIHDYYLAKESDSFAAGLIDKLQFAVNLLHDNPQRGNFPYELHGTQDLSYRQHIVEPFRIIYQIKAPFIFIHGVLDSRRNVRTILQRRWLNQ